MLKFICYPKCTTCQKAKKWLDDNKIEYELRDIKLNNPTLEMLKLLASDGMLEKRPLLVGDGFVLVGFKEAEWKEKTNA